MAAVAEMGEVDEIHSKEDGVAVNGDVDIKDSAENSPAPHSNESMEVDEVCDSNDVKSIEDNSADENTEDGSSVQEHSAEISSSMDDNSQEIHDIDDNSVDNPLEEEADGYKSDSKDGNDSENTQKDRPDSVNETVENDHEGPIELNDSGEDVMIVDSDLTQQNGNASETSPNLKVSNVTDDSEVITLDTPVKKKKKLEIPQSPPRRSSRNLNKQKSYVESDKEEEEDDENQSEESDIEEVLPQDPLAVADPLQNDKFRKGRSTSSAIVVKDTKRLVEIASKSSPSSTSGKKEPTLVIIDTNSILSGRGPVPLVHSTSQNKSMHHTKPPLPLTKPSMPSYPMLPMALPAQGIYPPNMRATITPIPMNPAPQAPPKPVAPQTPPAPVLPTLTDDMFVVEAPSFIVPYVYEKPPLKDFKDFVKELHKEQAELKKKKDEEKIKEEEKRKDNEKNKEEKDKDEEKEKDAEKNNDDKKDEDQKKSEEDGKSKDSKEEEIEKKKEVDSEGKDNEKVENEEKDTDGVLNKSENDTAKKSASENDIKCQETINSEEEKKESIDVEDSESTDSKKPYSYFDSPLGKFFVDIGTNLVQEYVQTDLLKQQKRKREREGGQNSQTNKNIMSLIKNLEFTKENNEPYKMELKKCEFCSFRTESALAMAFHLETPHMKNFVYRCNFCSYEVRSPHDILFHMEAEHAVRGRLERAPAFHQCPNCPFEDNQKGKLSRHLVACMRKFKPERNLEPPVDWEPPAKIPRVPRMKQPGLNATANVYQALAKNQQYQIFSKMQTNSMIHRGRGRPSLGTSVMNKAQQPLLRATSGMVYKQAMTGGSVLVPTSYQLSGNQLYQVVGGQELGGRIGPVGPMAFVPNMSSSAGTVTIQQQNSNKPKAVHQPSISITPLPRASSTSVGASKPGDSNSKNSFVICEICDGYIKDLEQLRNHMQWIHKVKIHPKMIYNRPPLNCQKCQFRFFTDQGLERHLLGSHGLVTSSMQEAANKSKDAGRCPVCGRVYQWKLLNHVARDHNMTLKPAHLSYKCTVCTATFGMYKQFENHVYSAHSVVAKRVMDKKSTGPVGSKNDTLLKPLKINDEITIIPQPTKSNSAASTSKEGSPSATGSTNSRSSNGNSVTIKNAVDSTSISQAESVVPQATASATDK